MNLENLQKNLQNFKDNNGANIDLKTLLSDFSADLSDISEAELERALKDRMSAVFNEFKSANLINIKNLKSAIEGINQALISAKERELYELIYEYDNLIKRIEAKREEIKNRLKIAFESAEKVIKENEFDDKNKALALLNDAIMRETRMIGILKESTQIAFLTALERGDDVDETTLEVAKNITYMAITGGKFDKERILEISRAVITASCEVASEAKNFAKALINGAVIGTREGVFKAIERLKEHAKFAPDELKLKDELIQLKNIDEEFIAMIRRVHSEIEGVAKDEIYALLNNELDTNFARLKRISEQASEQIKERIDELKQNSSLRELVASANEKFEMLKQGFGEQKLKFDELKQIDIKTEAKKLGERAYNTAKNFVSNLKRDRE